MAMTDAHEPIRRKPLRMWPGIVLAIIVVVGRYLMPAVAPDAEVFDFPLALSGILAGMISALAILGWWLVFSRAYWSERLAAVALLIVAITGLWPLVHESIRGGNMGLMLPIYSIPILSLGIVAWAVATRHVSDRALRHGSLVAAIVLASVPFVLIRTAGVIGTGAELHWRWTPTPEERLLVRTKDGPLDSVRGGTPPPPPAVPETPPAEAPAQPPAAPSEEASATLPRTPQTNRGEAAARRDTTPPVRTEMPAEWPGFRGPNRDSIITHVRIDTDWTTSPPKELWRRPIGPGWSSFAVRGELIYTQEQRGDDEIVACYRLSTGEPVWRHRDPVRFWESNGGPGPRGTPTIHNDRVYAFGGTGLLNALDARTGEVVWSRNAATDTGVPIPDWGFASSPLVIDDTVVIAVSGQFAAYDARTGHERWMGPEGGAGYSSPHLLTIDGVPQILLLRGSRTISVAPADGKLLWEHVWDRGVGIVQPASTADRDVLITVADAMGAIGMRRLAVLKGPAGWTVEERWTSRGLKPYFNDFVVHKGHAYGFDGSILACIDLETGARKWKGGRYGNGQLVLLAEQDVLLVVSEEGELALVSATPDSHRELARVPALEGKTWNHPVLVRDVLLVRNGEEMAAFRLSLARSATE